MPSISQLGPIAIPLPRRTITSKLTPPFLKILFVIMVPAPSFTITVPGQGYEITVPAPDELTPVLVPGQRYIVVVPERI
jgi:hypothetical protein